SRRRHTRSPRDWSSDVCSSDLLEIARTHPDPGVRRKAVKMVGDVATAEAALGVLERLAQRDPDVEVQQEAVEALGHLGSPQAIADRKSRVEGKTGETGRRRPVE